MRVLLRGFWIWIIILGILAAPVKAQTGLVVRIGAPDTSAYPRISAFLDVHDAKGQFVYNLQPDQVTVLEGGNTLPVEEISELNPGVQVVVAITPGPAFAIRNFQAISRYDLVKTALQDWVKKRLGTTTDDWSLLIDSGPAVSHTSDPIQWLEGLETDTVDARTSQSSIDTLARAVALASDSTPRPGMSKVILFITSSIEGDIDQAVKDISDQARQQNITIHLWMVASSGALITQSVQKLSALAEGTGGQVFNFSGDETLPDPEEYMEPLRRIYRFSYQSRVGAGGEQEFAVQVRVGEEQVQSNSLTFQIDLRPPAPAFVSPPILIERRLPPQDEEADAADQAEQKTTSDFLYPKEIPLQVVFDFPDGRKRDLVRSVLIVDGQIAAENAAPPFDQFIWRLDNYIEDGTHQLQVQTTDVLGLTGTSIEVPVQITVERLEADPYFVLRRNLPVISLILAVLAGALLFLVLVLGGRLRPHTQRMASRLSETNPLSSPKLAGEEGLGHGRHGWMSRLQRPHYPDAPNALAFLRRIADTDSALEGPPIPITSSEILLGSDPARVNLVIEEACIEGVHARLTHAADGNFILADQGSIAGTWVNYTPVDTQGTILHHGDLVHFGRIGFRFTFRKPEHVLKPSVALEAPTEAEVPVEEETEEAAP